MTDGSVFSSRDREQTRSKLVATAKADPRIGSAAHLGSAALGLEDRWSDIDLGLCLAPNTDINQVLGDWTALLFDDYEAVASFDVRRGDILYRVFLLDNTLQVDLSFWPFGTLRAIGSKFSLIFGSAAEPIPASTPDSDEFIGMAWLYALHVRSSIGRSRLLQAEYMLSGMRDNVLTLMCKRHGVDSVEGRGLDELPEQQRRRAVECLACSLEPIELERAFRATVDILFEEIRYTDYGPAIKLKKTMQRMVTSLGPQ